MSENNAPQPENNADSDQQLEVVIADYIRACETGSAPNRNEILKRFQVEAQAAAGLQHPNIVSIHEVGQPNFWPMILDDFLTESRSSFAHPMHWSAVQSG